MSDIWKEAEAEALHRYGDIIDRERPVSSKHPPMPMEQRAAIFSPFAALNGYEEAVEETGRLTMEKEELDEERKEQLNRKLQKLLKITEQEPKNNPGSTFRDEIEKCPEITVTWFVQDQRKSGGVYRTTTARIKKADLFRRLLFLDSGEKIPFEDLYDIRGKDL